TSPTVHIPFCIYNKGEPFKGLNRTDLNEHPLVHGLDPNGFPFIAYLARGQNSTTTTHTIYRFPNAREWHGLTEGPHNKPSNFTIHHLCRDFKNAYEIQKRLKKLEEVELKLERPPKAKHWGKK